MGQGHIGPFVHVFVYETDRYFLRQHRPIQYIILIVEPEYSRYHRPKLHTKFGVAEEEEEAIAPAELGSA